MVRSPDFWFPDGTVVLQVENTLYRLYRGLLASRSTVFDDTFSIPQPPEEKNEIEGCPVVQLHDKARDFTRFLKALHNYGYYKACLVSNFNELSSVLRLSDKYDVAVLRNTMISILSDLYPKSLDEWVNYQTPAGYTDVESDHILALNLAVKMNIRPVLPVIMYQVCCCLGLDFIMDGKGRLRINSPEYRKKCILGYSKLQLADRRMLGYLAREEDDGECDSTPDCDAERLRWISLDLDSDDVDPLAQEDGNSWESFGVCATCLEAAKETYQAAREKLWDDLPSLFELGTWEELLA
ncbi:hypothetical protein B0H19DRAFT_955336 [Mycena capillaripes]|nr:hypothetical protein B0H19DRAFT_955336 [Mycena capillaripes]